MRKTLLATTAAASILAFAAVAQQATDPAQDPAMVPANSTAPAADGAMAPAPEMAEEATPAEPSITPTPAPAMETAQPAPDAVTGPVLTPVMSADVSADDLMGATIQTTNGENIATVDDVVVSADGVVEHVVAQFGGFLGFGSNKVLLEMDEVEIMKDEAGNLVVQTALTPDSLEGRPEYQPEN